MSLILGLRRVKCEALRSRGQRQCDQRESERGAGLLDRRLQQCGLSRVLQALQRQLFSHRLRCLNLFKVVGLQAGTQHTLQNEEGWAMGTGIGYCLTKGIADADDTAVLLSDAVVDIGYK